MAIVVDANLVIALAVDDDRAPAITAQFAQWARDGERLHAPDLLPYEVASGLTRMIAAGTFPDDDLARAAATIWSLPITYHALDDPAGTVEVALQLGRRSAYDAAYIVLDQHVDAELWTFGGPLARNAAGHGLPVRLLDR